LPVRIRDKEDYTGSVTPSALNTETTVIEVGGYSDDFIVEGYIDVANLAEGEVLEIREYIAIDGTNYRLFEKAEITGVYETPAIRFHSKLFYKSFKYKVTIIQKSGTLRSFPYAFIVQILEVI